MGDPNEVIGIFAGQPPSVTAKPLALEKPPEQMFASRDGRYVAYVDWDRFEQDKGSRLRVAKVADLPAFETIAESKDLITSVGWAPDASILTYFTSPPRTDEGPNDGAEELHSVRPDGTENKLVASFKAGIASYAYRTILGVDTAAMNVLWTTQTREGAGGARGLTKTSIATGKSTPVGGDTGVVYSEGLALSPDLKKLYYVRNARTLLERNLDQQTERTLYEIDPPRECALESVLIDPSGTQVVFYATQTPIVTTACSSEPKEPQARTYKLRLADLDRTVLRAEAAENSLRPQSWSPDGRFTWFSDFKTTALWDMKFEDFLPYSDEDEAISRWFLAWVVGVPS